MTIKVEHLHDRRGVSLLSDNDYVILDLEESKKLLESLRKAIVIAEYKVPPAPSPIDWSKEYGKEAKEWAGASACHGNDNCHVDIAKYELGMAQVVELRSWCSAVIKYHLKRKCTELKRIECKK